jgi:hypothetical protein
MSDDPTYVSERDAWLNPCAADLEDLTWQRVGCLGCRLHVIFDRGSGRLLDPSKQHAEAFRDLFGWRRFASGLDDQIRDHRCLGLFGGRVPPGLSRGEAEVLFRYLERIARWN